MFLIVLVVFSLCLVNDISASDSIILNTETAESTLNWVMAGSKKEDILRISGLPGNQIMEQLMFQEEKNALPFDTILVKFAQNDSLPKPNYLIDEILTNQREITQFIKIINESDFKAEVYARAKKYFPASYVSQQKYEIFFAVTGWEWGDAMTFHYTEEDDKYRLSKEGRPAIIFNLTIAAQTYGKTSEQRVNTLKNVMSHEIFHALFSDYTSSYWLQKNENSFSEEVLTLILNEGIAHFITYGAEIAQVYEQSENIKDLEERAFKMLESKAEVIFAESQSIEVRRNTVNEGTYGQFWDKYLCITGLFMVYHIKEHYGIEGITQSIMGGGQSFINLYKQLSEGNNKIPSLPKGM